MARHSSSPLFSSPRGGGTVPRWRRSGARVGECSTASGSVSPQFLGFARIEGREGVRASETTRAKVGIRGIQKGPPPYPSPQVGGNLLGPLTLFSAGQAVTKAGHRLHHDAALAIGVQLAAEALNMRVDGVITDLRQVA